MLKKFLPGNLLQDFLAKIIQDILFDGKIYKIYLVLDMVELEIYVSCYELPTIDVLPREDRLYSEEKILEPITSFPLSNDFLKASFNYWGPPEKMIIEEVREYVLNANHQIVSKKEIIFELGGDGMLRLVLEAAAIYIARKLEQKIKEALEKWTRS